MSLKSPRKTARWWHTDTDGRIVCTLCPRFCKMAEGQAGFCYIRQNIEGELVATAYGQSTGFAIDPIEKKPLSHFLPTTAILSFGTAGCNLGCRFCQNWHMSKARLVEQGSVSASPEAIVDLAVREGCPSIAMTYNDPTIFGEYVIDVSREARHRGIKSVLVTAGYITPEARREAYQYIDAVNVDLKAFSETFYHKITFSHLEPVLDTLRWIKQETDIWCEITNLIIPGENDSWEETQRLCAWVAEHMGPNVPLHFTAFHPDFKMQDKTRTPPETLYRARRLAMAEGLNYVYVGNIHDVSGQSTYCPSCQKALIVRDWHQVTQQLVVADAHGEGRCPECSTVIAGVFR